jgi:hypothetical protein
MCCPKINRPRALVLSDVFSLGFVLIWVGTGNADPIVGTFLLNVDTRFPRLMQPILSLTSGSYATLNFSLKIPATVEKGQNFMGQSCLMRGELS